MPTKSFVLEQEDIETIRQKAKEGGNTTESAALRSIIREWVGTRARRAKLWKELNKTGRISGSHPR